jgi:hypothetical protein
MEINLGVTGAKRTSFREPNPRDLLRELMEKNPKADEARIRKLFTEAIEEKPEYLPTIIEYFLTNAYRSLTRERDDLSGRSRQEAREQVEEMKGKIIGRLLDLIMPSGKALAQSTGAECAKAGGWFATIAAKVGPSQVVGNVLSEHDLHKLFKRAQGGAGR